MPEVDLHSLTLLVEGGAAFAGVVLGISGLRTRVDHLEDSVQALHRRLTAWGAPEHVEPEPPRPKPSWWRKGPGTPPAPPPPPNDDAR